jgi:chaperonin GroES
VLTEKILETHTHASHVNESKLNVNELSSQIEWIPLHNQIMVLRQKALEKTKGGVFIPETVKEKPQEGTVLKVGSKVEICEVGDDVIFSKYAGSKVRVDSLDVILISEQDILAHKRVKPDISGDTQSVSA